MITVPPPGRSRLEQAAFVLVAAFAAALQISIAASQILLGLALLAWLASLRLTGRRPAAPAFFVPLLLYAAWTLVACAFSPDPAASLVDSRQLLLLLVVPIVHGVSSAPRARLLLQVILTVGAVSAIAGVVQYALLHYDTLGRRPDGALSHYMTYAGTLMLVICGAAAMLLFERRGRAWPALIMPALVAALVLTFTRGAWVGALAGTALLFAIRDFRLLALLPVVVAVVFATAPDRITTRMLSMFDLRDPTNRDRLAMMRTGAAIIRDEPLTGVGPNMIPRVYDRYRDPDAVNVSNPHLHNVPLQIAAERGLPALAAWLWFVIACGGGLVRLLRAAETRTLAAAGIAALAAMVSAGLFEYNFGDSEFLMLFLVLVTLPFAAARTPWPATP